MVKGIANIGNIFKKKDKTSYKQIQENEVYSDPLHQHGIRKENSPIMIKENIYGVPDRQIQENEVYCDPLQQHGIRNDRQIQENEVYCDPLQQHGVRNVNSQNSQHENPDAYIYAEARTKQRFRRVPRSTTTPDSSSPSSLTADYSDMVSHTTFHAPPAHNPNYMFQDPYEIPISMVSSTEDPGPPYMDDPCSEEFYLDDVDSEVEFVDQNIHSLCKNGIGGLYENIETVEVKQTLNLFGGYEDVWSSESAKKSLYKNLHDDDMAMSDPELNQIGNVAPVKPMRTAALKPDKPKLSIKYATPPLPEANTRARCDSLIKRYPHSPDVRRESAPTLSDNIFDENTPPPLEPRSPVSHVVDRERDRSSSWSGREKKFDVCNSDEILNASHLELSQQRWFFGPFTRLRAEVRLNATQPSTFLVRVSTNDNSEILSLKLTGGSVAHIKLQNGEQGVSLVGSNKTFSSVPYMISYYTNTPITLRQLGLQQILMYGLVSMK